MSIQLDYERSARTRIPPWHVVAAVALNVVGASMLMTGIFFVMKHEHGWTTLQNLRLSAGQGACYVFGALLAARWAKRMGRAKGFALSSLAQAIPPAVLLLGPATPWLMIGVLLQYAFVNGSTWPILQSMLTSGADARNMSKRVGMYNLTWSGLGTVVLAVIGTILTLWPAGVWYIAIAAHLGAAGIVLSLRRVDRLAAEAPAETLPPEPALLRQRRQALWLSRIGLPASLVVVYIMLPMMPGLPVIQQLDVAQQTLVCSTWMAARWTMFAILGATSWWHTRPRIILLAGMVMLGTMLGVLLPPFDALGINLAWMVGMQVLLGASMGLIFSASLYFGMVLSDGATEHGGYHEALVGVGAVIGPAGAAVAQMIFPGNTYASAGWASIVVGTAVVACAIVSFRPRAEVARSRA